MVYEQYHHPINNDGIRCCCGQAECAFLRENQLALEAVEKDLDTAARLGQVSCILWFFCFLNSRHMDVGDWY